MCLAIAVTGLLDFTIINLFGIAIAIPFFIAVVLTGEECMGGGDIKLIAAMGVALGYAAILECMIFFFVILVVFILIKKIRQGNCKTSVPLIPFLTVGYIITITLEVL